MRWLLVGATATAQVIITGVEEGGAADRAGICSNDIIVRMDNQSITTASDFTCIINKSLAGDEISLTVRRGNNDISLTIVVGATSPLPPTTNDDGDVIGDNDEELRASPAHQSACLWRREDEMLQFIRSLRSIAGLHVSSL
jgi:predicted metalloprotease with PDZ domain